MLWRSLSWLGRAVGALTGALLSVAWSFAIWVPTQGVALTGFSFVVALLMAAFALFATIASIKGHFVVVVLVFLASFFPVGVALITADHWLQWIGRLDFGYLIAALLMWAGARGANTAAPSPAEQR
jgi:hypothetical protein